MNGDMVISGVFIGKYIITSTQRSGGTIDPVEAETETDNIVYHEDDITFTISPNVDYSISDIVIDGVSQGPSSTYTFSSVVEDHSIIAVFVEGDVYAPPQVGDEQIFTASVPPLVMLVMGRNHKLYYEAYNDASDLDGDGILDVGYKPSIDYYGYFDSYKVYTYSTTNSRFEPLRETSDKKVDPNATNEWSGDYLNYLTMSRMDTLRKVLYGGYRSTDTETETVLERAFIPQDAHTWGKEYRTEEYQKYLAGTGGYDIREYTPLDLPIGQHLFASTTLSNNGDPVLRVLPDNSHRIWE
jgi:type IV pilus assembly protein PilY1